MGAFPGQCFERKSVVGVCIEGVSIDNVMCVCVCVLRESVLTMQTPITCGGESVLTRQAQF